MIIYSLQRERLVNLYLFSCSIRDHLKYIGTSIVMWSVSQLIKDPKELMVKWKCIILVTFLWLWSNTMTKSTCRRESRFWITVSEGWVSFVVRGIWQQAASRETGAGAENFGFSGKHKAERRNWKWGKSTNFPVPLPMMYLPSTRTRHVPTQHLQPWTKCSNVWA